MMKDVNSETFVKNSGPQDQIVLKRQRMVCFRDESVHPRAMLVTEIGGARPPNEIVLD